MTSSDGREYSREGSSLAHGPVPQSAGDDSKAFGMLSSASATDEPAIGLSVAYGQTKHPGRRIAGNQYLPE